MSSHERLDLNITDKMVYYKGYIFKKRINFHEPGKYLNIAKEIRKYFPASLKVIQTIKSVYNKSKKDAMVKMDIDIFTENNEDKEKFEEVKSKLEEILDCKLIEKRTQ